MRIPLKLISEPNNEELIEDSMSEYWRMIDYLKDVDLELYLYALETPLEKPTFSVRITELLISMQNWPALVGN